MTSMNADVEAITKEYEEAETWAAADRVVGRMIAMLRQLSAPVVNADMEAMLKWCDEAADEFPYAAEIAAMLRRLDMLCGAYASANAAYAAQTGEPVLYGVDCGGVIVYGGSLDNCRGYMAGNEEMSIVPLVRAHPPVASTIHGQVRPVDETRDELAWKIAKRYGEPSEDGGFNLKSHPLLLRAVDALLSHPPVAQQGDGWTQHAKFIVDALGLGKPVAQPLPAEHPGHPYAYHGVPAAQPLPVAAATSDYAEFWVERAEVPSKQQAQPLPDVRAFVESVWATATAPKNDTTLEQLMKAFGERVIRAWVKR